MNKEQVRILLVDDFEMVRVMMRRALTDLGYRRIEDASNGRDALVMIKQSVDDGVPYSVVFCDWMMDGLTGLDVLETTRQSETMRNVPIIMVTAEAEQKSIVQAMKAGAKDYIVKPIVVATLQAKLERLLSRQDQASA